MPTELQLMLAGELYDADDPKLVVARARAKRLCRELESANNRTDSRDVLGRLFAAGAESATVEPPFRCDYGSQIHLGREVYFNFGCVVLDVCEVRVGDFAKFGPGVHIYAATHPMNAAARRGRESGKPVTIGDDVWVGGGAVICPGVRIGDRSVIGAGSIVTRDVPDDVFAAGNPCRVIRPLS